MTNLNDDRLKVAIITGASSGIGRAVAVRLSSEGFFIVLVSRALPRLVPVAAEIASLGGKCVPIACNVRLWKQVRSLVDHVMSTYGQVDVLVTSAGLSCHSSVCDASIESIEEVIETNYLGTLWPAKAVGEVMKHRGKGVIILLGSVIDRLEWPHDALYASSKAAVHRLGIGMYNELLPYGPKVCVLVPGVVKTPLADGTKPKFGISPKQVAAAVSQLIENPKRLTVLPTSYRILRILALISPRLAAYLLR